MFEKYTLTPRTYMFNYWTGSIDRDLTKFFSTRNWRIVTSYFYPFPITEVYNRFSNVEKVYCYWDHKEKGFYGYIAIKNTETGFLDQAF